MCRHWHRCRSVLPLSSGRRENGGDSLTSEGLTLSPPSVGTSPTRRAHIYRAHPNNATAKVRKTTPWPSDVSRISAVVQGVSRGRKHQGQAPPRNAPGDLDGSCLGRIDHGFLPQDRFGGVASDMHGPGNNTARYCRSGNMSIYLCREGPWAIHVRCEVVAAASDVFASKVSG